MQHQKYSTQVKNQFQGDSLFLLEQEYLFVENK